MVRDDEIARVLEETDSDPHTAAEALIRAANAAGGEDNVTVVLFELVDGEPAPRAPAAAADTTLAAIDPDADTSEGALDDVHRHGAGKGSRWPALLLVAVVLAVAAFVLWWSLVR
jgi:hypothetical protein